MDSRAKIAAGAVIKFKSHLATENAALLLARKCSLSPTEFVHNLSQIAGSHEHAARVVLAMLTIGDLQVTRARRIRLGPAKET